MKPTLLNTRVDEWHERDRDYASLDTRDGVTIFEAWDDDYRSLVEAGFIEPRRLHASLVEYANHLGLELPGKSWITFTRRTDDPKLAWLERRLDAAGIEHRRNGESFHAPILEVPVEKYDAAWAILTPVDDIEDDDPRFFQE